MNYQKLIELSKMSSYIISAERVGLRRWLNRDTDPFAAMNKDESVMKYFPKKLSHDESLAMLSRIELHFEKNRFGLFAVENKSTGEFMGFTGFAVPTFESFFTPCVEIGWRFKKEFWGQGYATEAAAACLQYGFQILQFKKIVSFTSTVNVNSEKVMRRIGMIKIGEFNHPAIEKTSFLCRHVLYEIKKRMTVII